MCRKPRSTSWIGASVALTLAALILVAPQAVATAAEAPAPPTAKKIPVKHELHGDVRRQLRSARHG